MAYKPKILTVSEGGFGVNTHTPYVPICGGSTSTGAVQDVASIGSATNALTSNGAGALPTFQPLSSGSLGYLIKVGSLNASPTSNSTYYFSVYNLIFTSITTTSFAAARIYIPISGTINFVYGSFKTTTQATGANCTLSIRLNNTTDSVITSTLDLTTVSGTFNTTTLGLSVTAGDYISVKLATNLWSVNPSGVYFSVSILLN